MPFYGAYIRKMVGKATRDCCCCMVNVGIRCYVIFQKKKKNSQNGHATNDLTQSPNLTNEMIESAWANIGFFLYQLDPELRRLVRRLERLHLKKRNNQWYSTKSVYIYSFIYIKHIITTILEHKNKQAKTTDSRGTTYQDHATEN